jgi:lysophospholipase L1-like esterase
LSRRDGPVLILQIGDSHTANGAFTAHMKELFAARFGDAGSGMLPPGVPYDWYRPVGIAVRDEGWRRVTSYSGAPGPFGLAGLRKHTDGPAEMTVDADSPGQFADAGIEVLRQPGGGTLEVSVDGAVAVAGSTAGSEGAAWIAVPRSSAGEHLIVRAQGDGPVDVLGWRFGGARPGVQYANLGTIGATAELMAAWDQRIAAGELALLKPAALVVAFGTNEGFKDGLDLAEYRQIYAAQLHALRKAAPDAALIVLGPPDGERKLGRGGAGLTCDGRPVRAGWVTPPNLDQVRETIREIAGTEGAFYWDWRAAMGGPCAMHRWASADPPLAHSDHVHLRSPGYAITADALFAALMAGYERYLQLATAR